MDRNDDGDYDDYDVLNSCIHGSTDFDKSMRLFGHLKPIFQDIKVLIYKPGNVAMTDHSNYVFNALSEIWLGSLHDN